MAPAGVLSSVPGVRGCAARVPGTRPAVRGRAASTRSTTPPRSTAVSLATARRRGVAVAAGVVPCVVAPGGIAAARQAATRPMSLPFAAASSPASFAVQSRARVISNAGKGSQENETPAQEPQPTRGFMWKVVEGVKNILGEAKRSMFTLILLLISIALANLANKQCHPFSGHAAFAIVICEKGEKFFKFVSHIVPIAIALWNCFRKWYVNIS
ncbi:hypothetical protein BAE44_0021366 [Dichanthelium oligosanthes]|uniref:Uncharacterized protein n=1 Tax=Dichanthelium oligosanthes TaxID=888268 RepID=A0A1E5UXT7_9POAL|nr:hypothetical protein BAE44_0021366 [Dichanthelium oligosanthes]